MRVLLAITDEDFYEPTGYADAWCRALRERGADVERLARVPPEWALDGPPRGRWDVVIAHVLVEEVAAFAPVMKLASVLETAGAPLLNPLHSIVTASDKLLTHAVWAAHGLPQPAAYDLALVEEWPAPGRPMVLKPSLCDGARHVALVDDLPQARAIEREWREDERAGGERRGSALLQEWVREPKVVRLFATPERCSLAYQKARGEGEIVTHGTVYPEVYEAPPAMARLARRMVATLGGGLMGVDVLVDAGGRHLALEANAPFGFDVTDPEQGRFVADAALARAAGHGAPPIAAAA